MNPRSRRTWCRTLFVAGCLLPTMAVAAMAVWRHLPLHVAATEAKLSEQLGLTVRLSGMTHARPHVTLYHDFTVLDPETEQSLLKARLLTADRTTGALSLDASQMEIDAAAHERLWRLLCDRLENPAENHGVELVAREVTLVGRPQSLTLTYVHGGIQNAATLAESWLKFRVAGLDMPQSAEARAARRRSGGTATTVLTLETGGAALPCAVITALLPEIDRLGPAAGFRGRLSAQQAGDGWQGGLAGEFENLDLYSLVTAQFPHRLNGPARVTIDDARFRQGRLHSASGQLVAGPGVVSRSLLDAAAASWGASRPDLVGAAADAPIVYQQLAVRFAIDESGLRLIGQCGGTDSGHIMTNRSGPLLSDPPRQPLPVVSLVRVLVPDNTVQVPATRETEPLVGWLPVPHIQRSRSPLGESPPGGRLLRGPQVDGSR